MHTHTGHTHTMHTQDTPGPHAWVLFPSLIRKAAQHPGRAGSPKPALRSSGNQDNLIPGVPAPQTAELGGATMFVRTEAGKVLAWGPGKPRSGRASCAGGASQTRGPRTPFGGTRGAPWRALSVCTHLPAYPCGPRAGQPPGSIHREPPESIHREPGERRGCTRPGCRLRGPPAWGASTAPWFKHFPGEHPAPAARSDPSQCSMRGEEEGRWCLEGAGRMPRAGCAGCLLAPGPAPRAAAEESGGGAGREPPPPGPEQSGSPSPPRAAAGSLHPGHGEPCPAEEGGTSGRHIGAGRR